MLSRIGNRMGKKVLRAEIQGEKFEGGLSRVWRVMKVKREET